ncbi:hypothetical protein GGI04_001346 [Coemansia thaxteri]|nr:hypothetical protein GGI04_001346 [Coemansia thaxteri]
MLVAAVSTSSANITWDGKTVPAYTLNEHSADSYYDTLVPVRVPLVPGCALNTNSLLSCPARVANGSSPAVSWAAVVVWQEAVAAGCFSFAQVYQLLADTGCTSSGAIKGIVFGSSVDSPTRMFGSPLVEPYGDLHAHNPAVHVVLVAASTAKSIASFSLVDLGARNATIELAGERSLWSLLTETTGFAAQKYVFLILSAALTLYTLWEVVLTLRTHTAWSMRIVMYMSAIAYLIVFTVLQARHVSNRALQMAAYASWIVGYVIFTLFVVAWSAIVEKLHSKKTLLRHHCVVHYSSAAIVSLSVLLKLWAFAAESYQFLVVVDLVIAYEIPAIFGLQTLLLGYLAWSFLHHSSRIAISKHTKSSLRNVIVLCMVAILGCACMVAMGVTVASPARYTLSGYMAVTVLYKLGQCLMLVAIFGVHWVREHARRTRPKVNEHEFYVDVDSHRIHAGRPVSNESDSHLSLVGRGAEQGRTVTKYANIKVDGHTHDQSCMASMLSSDGERDSVLTGGTVGRHEPELNCYRQTPSCLCHNDTALASTARVLRKQSKRHVYVPLESISGSQISQSASKRLTK